MEFVMFFASVRKRVYYLQNDMNAMRGRPNFYPYRKAHLLFAKRSKRCVLAIINFYHCGKSLLLFAKHISSCRDRFSTLS